jgi:hypothetical protein
MCYFIAAYLCVGCKELIVRELFRCKQILDILRNRDRKPSPNIFDKSVLDLHEHLTKEHTIGDDPSDNRVQRICFELLESKSPGNNNNRDFLVGRS